MRKLKCILVSILVLTLPVFALCACKWFEMYKSPNLVNVVWQTDENEYGIDLTFTVLDHNGDSYGTFKYENKEYDIRFGWGSGMVDISYIGHYGCEIDYFSPGKGFTITGSYTIIKSNVVEIRLSYIYGDFEGFKALNDKKITVRATDIDPDEYDVSDINCVMWQSKDTEWKLYTDYGMRRFSVGTYGVGEETKIAVFWLANNTFRAYKLKDGKLPPSGVGAYIDIDRIDGDVFIVGTYTNDNKQLHLTYTVEGDSQLRFAILYCQQIDDYVALYPRWYPSSPNAAPFLEQDN